uniref:Putative structural protein n=1 Tax=viral metagenome TaxID=1070528 RepID=A0A6M3IKE7_9ZZZZ
MAGIRADQVALYLKDMYKAEREGYMEVETKHDKVLKVVNNVNGAGDKITQLLGQGKLTRHTVEGQQIVFKSPVQGWEFFVKYHTFSDGIALSKEAVEDTVKLGNLLKDLAESWGKQERICKEELGVRPFNEGGNLTGDWVFNGSHTGQTAPYGDMLYDNFPLFNLTGNARSTKGGGTYYNSVAGLTVTPGNFETLYILHTVTNAYDERDNVVRNPCDTLLVRPGADRFAAEKIIETERGLPGGQLNDKNVYYKLVSAIIDWDYIESTAGFFLGKRQSNDMQFRERQKPEIRFFRDEGNLGYKASINIRLGILIKNFRIWTRGGGTSA